MATILSAASVIAWTSITATAGTIVSRKYIERVEAVIPIILNNTFTTELYVQDEVTFNATGGTITLNSGDTFAEHGFRAGQVIFVYNSYENDQYAEIASITSSIMTLASGYSVVDELSGASVLISVVKWPVDVQMVAADMVYYDSDIRGKQAPNVKSRSLGPLSESFVTGSMDEQYGYPDSVIDKLSRYRIARLN